MTSDWGNQVFVEAGKKVVSGIFVGCKDNESDKGDRIESLFNISFWAKEGAIDWRWLGLDSPGKERTADSLAMAMEWMCFKISRDGLRADPNLEFNYEKTMGKLPDVYSAFMGKKGSSSVTRKGNPHDDGTQDPDDGVDFGGPDDEDEP